MTIAFHRAFIRLFQHKRTFIRKENSCIFCGLLIFIPIWHFLIPSLRQAQPPANVICSPFSFTLSPCVTPSSLYHSLITFTGPACINICLLTQIEGQGIERGGFVPTRCVENCWAGWAEAPTFLRWPWQLSGLSCFHPRFRNHRQQRSSASLAGCDSLPRNTCILSVPKFKVSLPTLPPQC